jgi:hypothetical protein
MSRSTPHLSDIARELVVPEGIVTTGWPAVASTLGRLGLTFDPWQRQLSQLILGKRSDGLFAAGVGGVVWSSPRQIGKTFLLGGLELALALLYPGWLALWTSHSLRTTGETFRAMKGMCQMPEVRSFVAPGGIHESHTAPGIELANGSRILFGSRERGFGVGFARVDSLVVDEAQRVTQKALDDMVPTMNHAPNPLAFFTGTPPGPHEDGEAFGRMRSRASKSVDQLYLEFGANPDCDPVGWPDGFVDWDQVARANPSFPRRTSKASILRMLELLGPASFRRAGLGLWDQDAREASLIDVDAWAGLQVDGPPEGVRSFGVKFAPDGSRVGLAVSVRPESGPVYVEVLEARSMSDGVGWLIQFLAERWRSAAQIVVDGKAGAGMLLTGLRDAGVRGPVLVAPSVEQVVTAHSMLLDAVSSGGVSHFGQLGLDQAVAHAGRRQIGTAGGWGFKPINGASELSALEAVTLAFWAAQTSRRKPGRRATVSF